MKRKTSLERSVDPVSSEWEQPQTLVDPVFKKPGIFVTSVVNKKTFIYEPTCFLNKLTPWTQSVLLKDTSKSPCYVILAFYIPNCRQEGMISLL